jgi:putative heme-binding domain-containing protein
MRNEAFRSGDMTLAPMLAPRRWQDNRNARPTLPRPRRKGATHGNIVALLFPAVLSLAFAAEPLPPERIATVIESLTRLGPEKVDANPKLKEALERVLEATRGTPQFVELVRDFKIQDRDPALLEIAVRNPNNSEGVQAVRLLLAHHSLDLLKGALAGSNSVQAAEVLGNTAEKEIVPLLEPVVVDAGRDVALRRQTVLALAQVQDGAAFLLRLAREQKLPEDLKLVAASELNHARWANIKAEAAAILPPPQGLDARPLPPISELIKMPGDAARGAAVFRRDTVGCVKCHQVSGEGVDFGPNLSEIGAKLGRDALFEAILDPSAGISFGFEAWQIELKSGDEAYGLVVSETADEIALKTPGNIVTRYKKSDIARREQQKLSIMPAGLQQTMSTQDLVDLVEYLASLKKVSK